MNRTEVLISSLFALLVMVPMPAAGGIKYLVALTAVILFVYIRNISTSCGELLPAIRRPLIVASMLLLWEVATAVIHGEQQDAMFAMARLAWLVIGFLYINIVTTSNKVNGINALTGIITFSLILMISSMLVESLFFPQREFGRIFGDIAMPFPRATGVPQSDGKIGVFIGLASVFFIGRWVLTSNNKFLALYFLAISPIMFTQSRSTLLAMGVSGIFLAMYVALDSKLKWARMLSTLVLAGGAAVLIFNIDSIFQEFVYTGDTFERNIDIRFEGNEYAKEVIARSPLFGEGAGGLQFSYLGHIVHNTFYGLGIKSGMIASVLFSVVLILASLGVWWSGNRSVATFMYSLSCLMIVVVEHWLYPGFFNEHIWLMPLIIGATISPPVRNENVGR